MGKVERLHNPNFRTKTLKIGLGIAFLIFFVHLFTHYGTVPNQIRYYNIHAKQRLDPIPAPPPVQDQNGVVDREPQSKVIKAIEPERPILDVDYVEQNYYSLGQHDPQLIQYTRVRNLSPPSKRPYQLEGKGSFKDQFGEWVANFFGNKVRTFSKKSCD